MSNIPDILNRHDLAKYLNVSDSIVDKLIREKTIPFFRVKVRLVRWRKQDVDRWIESRIIGLEVAQAIPSQVVENKDKKSLDKYPTS